MGIRWFLPRIFRLKQMLIWIKSEQGRSSSFVHLKGSHFCLERTKGELCSRNKFYFIQLESNVAVEISKQSYRCIFRWSEFISPWSCSKQALNCSSRVRQQEFLNFLTLNCFFIPLWCIRSPPFHTSWNPSTTHHRELATVGWENTRVSSQSWKWLPAVVRSP